MKKVFEKMKANNAFQAPEPLKELQIQAEKEEADGGAKFMATYVYDCSIKHPDMLKIEDIVMLKGNTKSCLVEEEDYIYAEK